MSFLKKLGDVANKAKEAATSTVQAANEQIQASKKECATCGNKIGFLTVYREIDGGGRVCDKCLEALGLTMQQYTDTTVTEDLKSISADDIKQAIGGDTDKQAHILNLQSVKNVAEKEAAKATAQAQKSMCATCGDKLGFMSLNCELISGERVCGKCLDKMGLSSKQYTDTAFVQGFMVMPLEDVQLALDGDNDKLEYILNLSSEMNAAELKAEQEANEARKKAEREAKEAQKKAELEAEEARIKAENEARDKEIQAKKEISDKFASIFVASKSFGGYVAFDDTNKMWRVNTSIVAKAQGLGMLDSMIAGLDRAGTEAIYEYYDYNIVMDVNLTEDATEKTTTKSKGGDLDFLFGDTMGALTSDKVSTTKKTINSLTVMVTTNNISNPTIYINFDGDDSVHAEQCAAVFKIIKSNNERSNAAPAPQAVPVAPQVSVADELVKFKGLLDAGVLTQDEFDKKKAELLNL